MWGRYLIAAIGVFAVMIIALLVFAWRPAIPPVEPPLPSSFPRDLVDKGERLARAGNCIDCHTVAGSPPGAGGKALHRKVGTFYSTNITPDPQTGIGAWSEAAFGRALREGVRRDGTHLFPVFPYTHYTQLTDADMRALYAYFMSQSAVRATNRPNTMSFPLDVRPLQALWKALFFKPGAYRDDPGRDAQWNRGAYLAEALGACSVCHTDRNLLGAEQVGHPYAGAVIHGWYATPLDISPSPARWSDVDLYAYLRHGESPPHGVALGPMRTVVSNLKALPDGDVQAIATYFATLNTPLGAPLEPALTRGRAPVPPSTNQQRAGEKVYLQHCASCHGTPGNAPPVAKSPLGLTASLWARYRPFNLLLTVLNGIDDSDGLPGGMPGFRDKLSDQELEALVVYLRASHTTLPAWGLISDRVTRARNDPMSLP